MAEFKLSRFKYTWEGEWSDRTRYNPDQIVSFGGKVYVSLETHTSNTDFYADLEYVNNDVPPLAVPKWELVADGVSWKGDWANSTYYVLGDVVKYGGTVYLCVNDHTSSPAAILDGEGNVVSTPGLSAFSLDEEHWTVQVASKDWKINWTIATYYKVNDVVRYGGRVYRCTQSHESAGDLVSGLESNQDSWEVFSIADDWKGVWTVSTRYKVNDIVKFGGNVYKCEIAHTSASADTDGLPADQAKWSSLHTGVEYKGDWAEFTTYKQNDLVKFGSYVYSSIGFHLSGADFESGSWTVYCPGNEYDVEWTTTTVYQAGDVVQYGGNLYVALELNAGQNPSVIESAWNLLFENSRIQGDWSQITDYKVGDVVRRGGNVYLAFKDSTNQDPDIAEDGSTTNEEYWDLVIPGIRWRGVWSPGEIYLAGDTVVWVSSSYKCLDKHVADSGNRPDDDGADSSLKGRYWEKLTDGNRINRLKNLGDIRTFGPTEDGSTIGYKALEVGTQGLALTSLTGEVAWDPLISTTNVYYVAEFGEDVATAGTSPQNPWRTVRYACENITGYATIYVRTGVYDEILPIRVPSFVAIVGDELRSTIIQPADTVLTADYITRILAATEYMKDILGFIVRELPIGNETLAPDTVLYGIIPQDFSGNAATDNEALITSSLLNQFATRLSTGNTTAINGTNTITSDVARLDARAQVIANKEFIKNETTLFIDLEYNDSSGALGSESPRWSSDLDRILDAMIYDMAYVGNYKTIEAASYFLCASDYNQNKIQNMFLMRDGTGLRNCTLRGLSGTLGEINIYGTRRPTAGAFASLDPGWGVGDTAAWVGTKSPYIQNVTTFGTGCVGLKIDGNLHAGGNQTIVCNDFTQILSDGIGVWANGPGRTECVSIFTYYNHIGYLSTTGGRIRGTNGNCSYGTYGAVSEGYNIAETPIVATVNNRYYDASIYQTLCNDSGGLMKLFYTHAGNNYTSATATIVGSGSNGEFVMDDFRNGGVSEVRITNAGDSSADGGSGYVFATNSAQGGNSQTVQLAGSDENEASSYRGMRVVLTSGTGVGQYGYIAEYEFAGKTAIIGLERQPQVSANQTFNSAGGNAITLSSVTHLTVGDAITFTGVKYGNIADNTVYYVKTIDTGTNKITISALSDLSTTFGLINGVPSGVNPAMVVHCVGWQHLVEGTPILALLDTSTNYYVEPRITFSSPGFSTTSATLPANRQWSSIASSGVRSVAVALDTAATAYSDDGGSTWSNGALPVSGLWTKIKYVGGVFMAFASGGQAARSADGLSWSSMTMSSTAEWSDVAYGSVSGVGTWVAVASGGVKAAKSTDGTTWSAFNLPEGADWNAIEYGKGKFVATALSDSSSTGAAIAYTTNATTWTIGTIPQGSYSLAYGNNIFVALAGGYAGATEVSTSVDGITWTEGTIQAQDWRAIKYAQGIFLVISTGTTVAATSIDGKVWEYQSLGASGPWCAITYDSTVKPGKFIVLGGLTSNSTAGVLVSTGKTAQARARVVAGRISGISLWDTGSGYTSAPVMVLTDPNNSSEVSTAVRLSNGVLGSPTILTAGNGYETLSTRTTISGDGYKDEYQIGSDLVISGLDRLPGPGDNIAIVGITDYTYKLLTCEILEGAFPNATAKLVIAKDLGREESPDHGTEIEIRQQYSQVRLTGHDFLDIGLGNFEQTNYPQTLFPNGTVLAPEDEIREREGGRVFYTSTDQDGNFRVGELFAVEQATGTVTLNAQFFELNGLEELKLGGVTVGGSGVVIREFSTDGTFTADSNNVVPTQKAVKAYLQRRVSGGGADAITGQLTAGIVRIGPDTITTTTGDELIFAGKVAFNGGIDGTWLAQMMFISQGS